MIDAFLQHRKWHSIHLIAEHYFRATYATKKIKIFTFTVNNGRTKGHKGKLPKKSTGIGRKRRYNALIRSLHIHTFQSKISVIPIQEKNTCFKKSKVLNLQFKSQIS